MGEFIKVAKVKDVPPGEIIGVDVGERRIAICNIEGQFLALEGICTHMGGPLDEGFLDGKLVQCPWHAGTFDPGTGEAIDPPASGKVPTFAVRVSGDDIEIEAPDS